MAGMTDTERVFKDLERYLRKIRENWESPVEVRTNFESFLNTSKKFRNLLPKDFKRITGKRWEHQAPLSAIGSLFSVLRDADCHERPVRLKVREHAYYNLAVLPPGVRGWPPRLVLNSTTDISDPHAEVQPDRLKLGIPRGGDDDGMVLIEPDRREYIYMVEGTSKKTRKLLEETGTNDLMRLCSAFLGEARSTFLLFQSRVAAAELEQGD
jgi:hypothetical protein